MTNNSNLVLRWEIDDATATFARRKAESRVFNEGGFKWKIGLQQSTLYPSRAELIISCGVDHNGPWKCEVNANLYTLDAVGNFREYNAGNQNGYCFDEINCDWKRAFASWSYLNNRAFNDKMILEYRFAINSCDRGQPIAVPALLNALSRRSDVTLNIGEKQLDASKEILAYNSPVFEAMFFGNFAENGKREVEIKDVIYEEFLDLLQLIYIRTTNITDHMFPHILKLSDQFQIEGILELSKKHLIQSTGFDTMQKLLIADQYRLASVREHCLESFTSANDVLEKITSFPDYAHFSSDMKVAICDRMVQLKK